MLLLGLPGDAKSPTNFILAFGMSRYHHDRLGLATEWGEIRTAQNLDYFRFEAGEVHIPAVLDDPGIHTIGCDKLKAFFDPSQKSAKTKERWGAASFVRNQFRCCSDNKVAFDKEPSLWDLNISDQKVTYEMFTAMIKPAFPDLIEGDVQAVLKRCVVCVNTGPRLFIRPPCKNTDGPIYRYQKGGLFISEEADKILTHYLKTGEWNRDEATFKSMVASELALFKRLLDSPSAANKRPYGQVTGASSSSTDGRPSTSSGSRIWKQLSTASSSKLFRQLSASKSSHIIDLEDDKCLPLTGHGRRDTQTIDLEEEAETLPPIANVVTMDSTSEQHNEQVPEHAIAHHGSTSMSMSLSNTVPPAGTQAPPCHGVDEASAVVCAYATVEEEPFPATEEDVFGHIEEGMD